MSASFYDLLKYAKTGIASPGMTAYDKMRAVAMGGGAVKTLTGVPPLSFRANGKPLISWSMLGNSQQNGTPAPDAPIMPEFVGERTENLFDYKAFFAGKVSTGQNDAYKYILKPNTQYTILCNVPGDAAPEAPLGLYARMFLSKLNAGPSTDSNGCWIDHPVTIWSNSDGSIYILARGENAVSPATEVTLSEWESNGYWLMFVEGAYTAQTMPAYEPYGYKLPITNAGQTVPIYLGQTQTVRRIKKLVLTGEEVWAQLSAASGKRFYLYVTGAKQSDTGTVASICTHFPLTVSGGTYANDYTYTINNAEYLYIRMDATTTLNSFKQWLADQYAAGTPVTIWYVLAEPETGIVNEPLCKIGDYADELHSADAGVSIPTARGQNTLTVDTDLKPSEMTITYRG